MKVYIFQRKIASLSRITEVHMFKFDISVCNFRNCIRFVFHFRYFIQNFVDTFRRRFRDHDHNEYKRHHHKRRQYLKCIDDHTCQLSCKHISAYDTFAADQHHCKNDYIHSKLHRRRVPGNDFLCFCKKPEYNTRDLSEFFNFMVFPNVRFHDAGCVDVFLNDIIQFVIFVKHLDKMRVRFLCDKDQKSSQNRNRDQHHKCDRRTDRHRHDQGHHDHDRRSCEQTDRKHIRHLYIRNVGRQSCHKTRR